MDTSAYLAVLLADSHYLRILEVVRGKILCSSILLLVEVERNLVRLSRNGDLSLKDYHLASQRLSEDRQIFLLREVTGDLCLTGEFPPVKIPKSSDLIHLRTAMWFRRNGGLEGFITLDEHQKEAAFDLKLPVS